MKVEIPDDMMDDTRLGEEEFRAMLNKKREKELLIDLIMLEYQKWMHTINEYTFKEMAKGMKDPPDEEEEQLSSKEE